MFDYLRHDKDFKHDHRIVIRVYANLRGLSKTYADKGILPNTAAFSEFVLGFNKAHPLFDFIDAGNHKEAADTKLKGSLSKKTSLQTVADFSLQKTSVCIFITSIANRSSSARPQTMAMHPS